MSGDVRTQTTTRRTAFVFWMATPSATGSEKGTPSSMISAPPASMANMIDGVSLGEGNPAVTKVTRAGCPCLTSDLVDERSGGSNLILFGLEDSSNVVHGGRCSRNEERKKLRMRMTPTGEHGQAITCFGEECDGGQLVGL
jgi:hypothetical protein